MNLRSQRTGQLAATLPVVVLVLLTLTTGITTQSAAAASSHAPSGRTYALPSDGWPTDGAGSMEAASQGPFHAYLTKSGACANFGGRSPMLWPAGYKVRFHPTELVDPHGRVVAHEGDLVMVGGGFVPASKPQRCTSPGQSPFYVQSVPRVVQTTYEHDGHCVLAYPAPLLGGTASVPIRNQPDGATVQWDPGSDSTRCKIAYGTIGPQRASTLVDELNAAPLAPASVSCPTDTGSEARLYFQYADGSAFGPVLVSLSGCRSIRFSDSPPRAGTQRLAHELSTIAPPAWRSSLTTTHG